MQIHFVGCQRVSGARQVFGLVLGPRLLGCVAGSGGIALGGLIPLERRSQDRGDIGSYRWLLDRKFTVLRIGNAKQTSLR